MIYALEAVYCIVIITWLPLFSATHGNSVGSPLAFCNNNNNNNFRLIYNLTHPECLQVKYERMIADYYMSRI